MYDYSSRWKDNFKFTSVDPLAEKYYSWSPYAYCANNPIKFVDPDGKEKDYPPQGPYRPEGLWANKVREESGWVGNTGAMEARYALEKLIPTAIVFSIGIKVAAVIGVEAKGSLAIPLKGENTGEPQFQVSGGVGAELDLGFSAGADIEAKYADKPNQLKNNDVVGPSEERSISVSPKKFITITGSKSTSQRENAGQLDGYGIGASVGLSIGDAINKIPLSIGWQKSNTKKREKKE